MFALVAGVVLQKVTLKFGGKYRSWFLVGPPVVAVLFLLQYTKIGSDSVAAIIIVFGYKIEDAHVLRMQDEIVSRKAGGSAR
ncbi:MAG: hypothetical protein JXR49_09905 [Acidobacteria bacterium]|nr:hypothetical protein [Acidobacteriota bacterium]